jgi:hypothetical protein
MGYSDLLINTCDIYRHVRTGIVRGTDGIDYLCTVSHVSWSVNKPVTGEMYEPYWTPADTVGQGEEWESEPEITSEHPIGSL